MILNGRQYALTYIKPEAAVKVGTACKQCVFDNNHRECTNALNFCILVPRGFFIELPSEPEKGPTNG